MLVKNLAELDGMSKALGNQKDPLLYGDTGLVDDSLSSSFECMFNLLGRCRSVDKRIGSYPRPDGHFKLQFLDGELDIVLDVPVGVEEVLIAVDGGDTVGHGNQD